MGWSVDDFSWPSDRRGSGKGKSKGGGGSGRGNGTQVGLAILLLAVPLTAILSAVGFLLVGHGIV